MKFSLPLFPEPSPREGAVSAKHPSLQLLPSLPARPSGEAPLPCHGRTAALSPQGRGQWEVVGRKVGLVAAMVKGTVTQVALGKLTET